MLLPINILLMAATLISSQQNSITTGTNYSLDCVNDYLYTIKCSLRLSISPRENHLDNSSYRLVFIQHDQQLQKRDCMLSYTDGYYFCSFRRPDTDLRFTDTERFKIVLRDNAVDAMERSLDENYMPAKNITPNAPCNLTVTSNSSQFHFIWKNSYEDYLPYFYLYNELKYELQLVRKDYKENPRLVETDTINFSADAHLFVSDTVYTARVRSAPNGYQYHGHWSAWTPELHWKTYPVENEKTNPVGPLPDDVVIALCVLAPILLLFCCVPFLCVPFLKGLRRSTFIPTPVPYFSSLYNCHQGDFKSWVLTPRNTDLIKTEETVQLDTLTKTSNLQEEETEELHQEKTEEGPCSGLPELAPDASCLGVPYAVTSGPPGSHLRRPTKSRSLCFDPESNAEEDSGCWLCSITSLEGEHRGYRNAYCILSMRCTPDDNGSVEVEHTDPECQHN